MTAEIDRRSLLKGFMFTAGVVAVGIEVPFAIVAPAPEPVVEDFAPEHGDIWINSAGRNHFIGKSIRITPGEPEMIEISTLFDPYAVYDFGLRNPDTEVEFYSDYIGMQKCYEHFVALDKCDIAFGLAPGYAYTQDCYITESELTIDENPFLKGRFVFRPTKPFVWTRQA